MLPLYGLSVPDTDDPDEVRRTDAVQLFMQTAQRVHGANVGRSGSTAVRRRICRLVKGCRSVLSSLPPGCDFFPTRDRSRNRAELSLPRNIGPGTPGRHLSLTTAFDHSSSRCRQKSARCSAGSRCSRTAFCGKPPAGGRRLPPGPGRTDGQMPHPAHAFRSLSYP